MLRSVSFFFDSLEVSEIWLSKNDNNYFVAQAYIERRVLLHSLIHPATYLLCRLDNHSTVAFV